MSLASAQAQPLEPLALTAASDGATAKPGAQAIFHVSLNNSGALAQDVRLNATKLPVGWQFNFTPDRLDVAPNGVADSTLVVHVPADATPGSTYPLRIQAFSAGGFGARSNPLDLNVTVTALPPPPATPTPDLTLSIASASAPAGTAVRSILTLYTDDEPFMRVNLDIAGDESWLPEFPDGDFVVADRGTPRDVPTIATIPATMASGTTRTFTITATVDSFVYTTTWQVTALAPLPASDDSTTPTQPTSGATGTTSTTPTPRPDPAASGTAPLPQFGLDASVTDGVIDIAPGGVAFGKIQLRNTGEQTLHLTIRGDAADGWPVSVSPANPTLDPGAVLDIGISVEAPADIIPGGTGSGTITITGDNGLLRTVPFQLAIQEGASAFPTTTTDAPARAPVPAPATITPGAALAIGGLAAVGATALAIARRPIREKLIWGAVGLYTRLARPDVLGHEERERLYRVIETTPGIHFHALQRDLNWNTGTLTYHLRVLERHGFVVSRRDGPYRRFYIQGAAPRKETFNTDGPHGLRADVLDAIRSHHGISQTDLALALGANKQTVNYHVKALERAGTIRVEKRGRETFLYPQTPAAAPGEVAA